MKISSKLTLVMLGVELMILVVFAIFFIQKAEDALNERVLLQLTSIKKLKRHHIEHLILSKKSALYQKVKSFKSSGDISEFSSEVFYFDSSTFFKFNLKPLTSQDSFKLVDFTLSEPNYQITLIFQYRIDRLREIAFYCPLPEIQNILFERTGMGETGESYLVGPDFFIRSKSRFYPTKKPNEIEVKTKGTINALKGKFGSSIFEDYRGERVYSAYRKVNVQDINWVILSEIDENEGLKSLKKLEKNLLLVSLLIFLIAIPVTFFLSQTIVKPILRMESLLNGLSKGEFSELGITKSRSDEIGLMYQALHKLIDALERITIFSSEIGKGNFNVEFEHLGSHDQIGKALSKMKTRLKNFREKEISLLRNNKRALLTGQENERSRLAKELHDGIGPMLTTLRMYLGRIHIDPEEKSQFKQIIDETIKEVRQMSNNLMPSVLVDFGIKEALTNYIEVAKKSTSVDIKYVFDIPESSSINKEISIALYRICQEALANALKYASSTEIRVSITEFEEFISFYFSDNGEGFDIETVKKGFGLMNIRDRVEALHGKCDISSSDKGTIIEIEISLSNESN